MPARTIHTFRPEALLLVLGLGTFTSPASGQTSVMVDALRTSRTFADATVRTGLGEFVAVTGDGHAPGAVFADLDNDGYPDLYLIGQAPAGSSKLYNALYLNRPVPGGERTFLRIPPAVSGAGVPYPTNGAVAGDYDNDGDLDLYVVAFGPNLLLRNQLVETGKPTFVNVTAATDPTPGVDDFQLGVGHARGLDCDGTAKDFDLSLTAAWSDVDRDGDLDLFVGTHNGFAVHQDGNGNFGWDPDRPPTQTSDPKPGSRDTFYRNNGAGADGLATFTDRTVELTPSVGLTGFETASGDVETHYQCYASSNAVIFADLNLDLWPDLVVTNKTITPDDRDMLYVNRGSSENGRWLGFEPYHFPLAVPCEGNPACFGYMSPGAMGIDVGDPDNDGDWDLYITDIRGSTTETLPAPFDLVLFNDLWVSRHSQTGVLGFVHDASLPSTTSWGTQWQDFDNDGDEDLHVATSFSDSFFVNQGSEPPSFVEAAADYGVADTVDARGDLTADYDRDGWVDILVLHPHIFPAIPASPARSILWKNQLRSRYPRHHYLALKLTGDPEGSTGPWRSTRDAIGARVRVHADLDGDGSVGPGEIQMREVRSGSSNAASTSSLELELGLALAKQATVEIFWPSGQETVLQVEADQFLWIAENGSLRKWAPGRP